MQTHTSDTGSTDFQEQLYDILMGAIEPDLTTDKLPILDELYLGETEGEYQTRMERYARALDAFKARAAEFTKDFHTAVSEIGDRAMLLAKQMQQEADTEHLKATEDSLEQS